MMTSLLSRLSLKSCFPVLADFESKEGSIVLGAIRQDVNAPAMPPVEPGTHRLLEVVDGARVWTLQVRAGERKETPTHLFVYS